MEETKSSGLIPTWQWAIRRSGRRHQLFASLRRGACQSGARSVTRARHTPYTAASTAAATQHPARPLQCCRSACRCWARAISGRFQHGAWSSDQLDAQQSGDCICFGCVCTLRSYIFNYLLYITECSITVQCFQFSQCAFSSEITALIHHI